MKKLTASLIAASLIIAGIITVVVCQRWSPGVSRLTITGTGVVQLERDRAQTSLAVSVLEPTATAAMRRATDLYTTVRTAVITAGAKAEDLVTSGVSVNPEYSYYASDRPVLLGYRSSISVTVETGIDVIAKVLDSAVTAGGDYLTITGISFTVSDSDVATRTSRIRAIADAKSKADLYADRLGLDVIKALKIVEISTSIPSPIRPDFDKGGGEAVIPIDAGTAKIITTVEITFALK